MHKSDKSSKKHTVLRLGNYLKPHAGIMLLIIATVAIASVADILVPKVLAMATNELAYNFLNINFGLILTVLAICLALYVLSAAFQFVSDYSAAKMTQTVVYTLRKDMKAKLDKLPIKYFDNNSRGDLISRVTNDIETIANTLREGISQIIYSVVTIVGVLVLMFVTNVWMTLVTIITVPIIVLLSAIIAKQSKKMFARNQKELGILNGQIEEIYGGHQVVKLYGMEGESAADFAAINKRLQDAGYKAQGISGMIMPMLNFVGYLSYIGLVVLGGYLVGGANVPASQRIKIGDIQQFMMYRNRFMQPLNQIANIANVIQSTIAAAERVFEIFDAEEEENVGVKEMDTAAAKGKVVFENVNFGYDKDRPLITNLNLEVDAGDMVAIVGPTGAGKTTIVNLLMRFYDIDSGHIYIDGTDITEYTRNDLRRIIGMVLQDTWLYTGSIGDNIAYGRVGSTREDVIDAAKKAHVNHYIETTEEGYDTLINEESSNISQGQKQLLTIARAILSDSKILILDEATSSVDTRTEQYIQNAMTAMMKGRTSFVIAHRLSTIKNAAKILVMRDGQVVEQGNHKELIAKNGFYAELYNAQLNYVADQKD